MNAHNDIVSWTKISTAKLTVLSLDSTDRLSLRFWGELLSPGTVETYEQDRPPMVSRGWHPEQRIGSLRDRASVKQLLIEPIFIDVF